MSDKILSTLYRLSAQAKIDHGPISIPTLALTKESCHKQNKKDGPK